MVVQVLVAVGQLQTYVEAMATGEEEEEISEIADRLGVLTYSLHQLASMQIADPSRLKRMTAQAAGELRSRQTGHVVADAERDDLISQITAWPFDYSQVRQLQAGIEYTREDEIASAPRRRDHSTWTTAADGALVEVPDDAELHLPEPRRHG